MYSEQRQSTEELAADSEAGLESVVQHAAAMFSEQRQATEAVASMAQQSANISSQGIAEAHPRSSRSEIYLNSGPRSEICVAKT